MMDLMQEAILLGFSGAAVMDTKELVFVPEYRTFCEENLCGCYNVNPACPPESGTVEEMKQRALSYEKNTGAADNAGGSARSGGIQKKQNCCRIK